jgi:CRISPR system Cascade subunit CasD
MEQTLLLQLAGMQSWGVRSRYTNRDTGMEPSKSGLIGMILCGLGRTDENVFPTLEDLSALQMAVRVDRQGEMLRDFQTIKGSPYKVYKNGEFITKESRGFPLPSGKYRSKGKETITCEKFYLQDAHFVVGLSGDPKVLEVAEQALTDPVWLLFLGRKCCPPTAPIVLGVIDNSLLNALKEHPTQSTLHQIRIVFESETGALRQDVPVSFKSRKFRTRRVTSVLWQNPNFP